MKFCSHCGKELMDEAVICPGCGCPVQSDKTGELSKESDENKIQRKKKNKKIAITIIATLLCVALLTFFVSIPLRHKMESNKKNEIIKVLSGREFEWNDDTTYSIYRVKYSFDDEGNCEKSSYFYAPSFSSEKPYESDYTFDWTYEIKFRKKSVYVVLSNDDELKIKYDDDGEIVALYDPEERRTYE